MRLALEGFARSPVSPESDTVRHPSNADADALAVLMLDAYRGSVDSDPDDTLVDARREVTATFRGDYGELIAEASFLALEREEVVSASIVTRFEGSPFIAFTMTRADRQRRGLSRDVLTRSLRALAGAGEEHVDLVVTSGNEPAERLYRSLGFETVQTSEG